MKIAKALLLAFGLLLSSVSFAQNYEQYIERYKQAAIDQMHKYHIPASITLAQALLESAAGTSDLAKKANNHFGIKVSSGWTGPYSTHDDDKKGERFRKYSDVAQSYEDHSIFLQKDRYKKLFQLDPLDYKGWAKGLKECGYATNPSYANLLISLIDRYGLHQYDEDAKGKTPNGVKNNGQSENVADRHQIVSVNGLKCVKVTEGDTWSSISKETGISMKKLLKYNEADVDMPIEAGSNIFLEKKAKKAAKQYEGYWHKLKAGESMYDVSQEYGVRLKYLYKMNFRDPDSYEPYAGDILKVR